MWIASGNGEVNKNTYFTDGGDNNLEYVTKGTVLTFDSDTVEFGRVYSDENAEDATLDFYGDGNSKSLNIRDISVNNKSEYLPKGVIGSTYTMNYY